MKNVFNYIKCNENKEEINNSTDESNIISNDNFNNSYLFKYLLFQIEESKNTILELKKEIDNLKILNIDLKNKLLFLKTKLLGHSIFFNKFIKNNNNTIINNSKNYRQKSKNIKDLFKNYLYYLKIYSPYVIIKENIIKKVHSFTIFNSNFNYNNKLEIYNNKNNIKNIINNIHYNNSHSESIFDDLSFLSQRQEIKNLELYLSKNNSTG